jgi:NADH-quinone oxidoreductase subunit E
MTANREAAVDLSHAEEILRKMGTERGDGDGAAAASRAAPRITGDDLIPLLQKIQDAYGYLPYPVLSWVSDQTAIPMSRMYGVITFYAQFYTEPHGRHTIRCCQGTACHVKGGKRIAEKISELLHVEEGGTTPDMRFTFETVACLGTCFLAPVMMVDEDYYGQLTPERIERILKDYD